MMHMVAAMLYGGYKFSLWDVNQIQREHPIPDLFNYSLTEGRDIFALAMQCCNSTSRGMETLFYELMQNGVPMDVDAPTVTGTAWRERLVDPDRLSAELVTENPIILSRPRRPFSGVDVITGNFFESAVVKISGMTSQQLDEFDKKAAFVLYYDNEDDANRGLLDSQLLEKLKQGKSFKHENLLAVLKQNAPADFEAWKDAQYEELFDRMAETGAMKISVVVSGQGPAAFGMPEMFTPMQHINANRKLKRLATLVSDGRYSGVTYGAAVGT